MYEKYPAEIQKVIHQRFESANESRKELEERRKQLAENRKKQPARIAAGAHGSNFGKIAEQILPAFITFPYKQKECRPLFEPVDYVIFTGLAGRGRVQAIKFVDVKTGDAHLSRGQRQIRDRVTEGRIKHRVIA
jgi:predicted Holliday junction resolvase-like endonuclease